LRVVFYNENYVAAPMAHEIRPLGDHDFERRLQMAHWEALERDQT